MGRTTDLEQLNGISNRYWYRNCIKGTALVSDWKTCKEYRVLVATKLDHETTDRVAEIDLSQGMTQMCLFVFLNCLILCHNIRSISLITCNHEF